MRLYQHAYALILAPVLALAAAFTDGIFRAVRFGRECVELLTPYAPRLAVPGHTVRIEVRGTALPSEVQNALRHESRAHRRSADRKT